MSPCYRVVFVAVFVTCVTLPNSVSSVTIITNDVLLCPTGCICRTAPFYVLHINCFNKGNLSTSRMVDVSLITDVSIHVQLYERFISGLYLAPIRNLTNLDVSCYRRGAKNFTHLICGEFAYGTWTVLTEQSKRLEHLRLSVCQLRHVPYSLLMKFESLTSVDLSNNCLLRLDQDFLGSRHLSLLRVDHNILMDITNRTLERLKLIPPGQFAINITGHSFWPLSVPDLWHRLENRFADIRWIGVRSRY